MTYQPYLIANYATGIDVRLQPWLAPDDAQRKLYDGFVYRGVMSKRPGYTYYATGNRGDQPYCESRIVNNITDEEAQTSLGVVVTGDGTAGPYTFQLQNTPIRRGTCVITAGAQTATDNGLGGFTTNPVGGTGTINYTTGDVTITFNGVVAGAIPITITYDYHPDLPVMGFMVFVDATNQKQLIPADTKFLNLYDSTTNTLNLLAHTATITNITQANPGIVTTAAAHNLSTGDRVFIYGVRGMVEVNNTEFVITVTAGNAFSLNVDTTLYTPYVSDGTAELIWQGSNVAPKKNFWSWVNYPDKDGNNRLLFSNNVNQIGYYAPNLANSVGNYVSYPTVAAPDFQMETDAGAPITSITCLQLFVNKDRLIMIRTTENGTIKPQRIRISGTGANSDDFRTTATGAGYIDIPDGTWIMGADFNRDDLLIFTEASVWSLKYTGNDTTPFVLEKIDDSRGSQAPFGVITYLNRTSALSPRGMIITDGYKVERQDATIPDFSFNEIDGDNFELCFAGSVDEDRDHYLIYPTPDQSESKRILVTNYDEDNYNIYRFPLSCMGNYILAYDITWNDLLIYENWDQFAADYANWNSFAFTKGSPFSLGGGHHGEVWKLNVTESEDNPVKIRNITIVDATTIQVTTDWNNFSLNDYDPEKGADFIFFSGVEGMVEVNDQQFPIIDVTDEYTFDVQVPSTANFTAYTTGGTAVRVIPFFAEFKKFNPYVNQNKKVRCGWLYMYVDSTSTNLRRPIAISDATQANPCVITTLTDHNLSTGDDVKIYAVGGMTELNDITYFITVIDDTSFSLNGIDSTGFTPYTSGGYASVSVKAKIDIDIITDDVNHPTQLNYNVPQPYQGTCTNLTLEDGQKKWYKVYINQVGKFIQFRVKNQQAGTTINIQATMPGFAPVGRMI